ncbi:TolC family outer membrane protein [Cronobacter turicensis]|jgi:adhesin transport system outer membrane protein|uniref:TolC family outer membrane protein n=1 Tax=Cronobacter turicensis TaxID=413502 RepID=UPI001DC947E9|nr:TolC family outer membrane protein [Cronobacter turicensis]EGT5683103.1 type I secretion system outer membrane protein [Cronobacter turicensis]EGT5742588.1 type I secretion system outer membrane protein [Cronobacter turicensis]EKM0378085.1 TolC family outer membrane protein [Cronobacter turicensis]ELQ6022421.1 TolC family outer membrane protein [Cronobacter turicensis]ELQ6075276.1 TolC family outer membrane protein [Cronobacter turicensis]
MHNNTMRYRRLALLLTTVFLSFPAVSQEEIAWQTAPSEQLQAQLTIKEAILRAFARNPKIAQAAAQIRVGKANLEEAQSAWFPQVSLQGNVGRNHRTDSSGSLNSNAAGGVNLKQLIYDFGKTGGSIDEQENLSEAYRFQLYDTLNQVGMQTLQAYLQVRRYQSLAAAAERNLTSLRSVQNMADLRAEAGLSTQSDVLQAQSRIAGMNATFEQYRAQARSAQAALSVLTGVVADTLPDLPEDLLRQPITLKSLPYEQTNAVRAAQAKQLAAEQRIRQAQAQHWPTVSVQAGRTRYQNDNANYWDDQVQLVVDAPVYQGGAVSARVEAAEGDRASARADVEASKLDINQKAATAWADLTGAQQRQRAGEQQIASAGHAREVYRDEYRLSKRSLNDLLSIEQDVFQADTLAITARYDAWDAAVRYAAAVDNLLDMLGIERARMTGDTLPSL